MSADEAAVPEKPSAPVRPLISTGAVMLALVGVIISIGLVQRFRLHDVARENATPSTTPTPVRVVAATAAPEKITLTLPGSIRPREHVTLYARTNGFMRQWLVDMGDAVKKGQVLARIDAPELAANLGQAKARFEQAKASIGLVRSQHERTSAMAKSGTLSPQDLDASSLHLAAAESELATSSAEVDRLTALVTFTTVTAPFDGTITRRGFDNGALVTNGTTALFDIASTDDLRIDVEVPQWVAEQVQKGTTAQVTIGKQSGVFEAEVARTSGALDPVLRTLGAQLVFKKAPTQVVPGSYARVKFEVPRSEPAIVVPGAVIAIRAGVPTVAVLQADGSLKFTAVKVMRDLGKEVELQALFPLGTKLVMYPPPALVDGDKVTAVENKQ